MLSFWEYVDENRTSISLLVWGGLTIFALRIVGVDPVSAGITGIFLMVLWLARALDRERVNGPSRQYRSQSHVPSSQDHRNQTVRDESLDGNGDP